MNGNTSPRLISDGGEWTRDEFLVTLDAYLNEEDLVEDSSDPKVKEIAALIDRTPGSIALRLANYRYLDPDATKGLSNTGQSCREIWEEFYGREDTLARAANKARDRLSRKTRSRAISDDNSSITTEETMVEQPSRSGQRDFREAVRNRYNNTCMLCDIKDSGLLQAGHILSWSEHETSRGDPSNGLLLCSLHHRAFDTGMFTLSESHRMVVRPDFEPASKFLQQTITGRDGTKIKFPKEPPSAEYLRQHNQNLYWWPPDEA